MVTRVRRGSLTGGCLLALLLCAGAASAVPIVFYEDLDSSGDFTPGEEVTGGTNGTGGAIYNYAFDLDATAQDLATTAIQLTLLTYDNNFEVEINGVAVVPVDPNDPAVFTPAIATPWTANGNGLPRLVIDLSGLAVAFSGSETTSSTSLTTGLVYAQTTVLPTFVDGQNTIVITNPDGAGPDGMDFSITGDIAPLTTPEPRTVTLLALGLIVLALHRR